MDNFCVPNPLSGSNDPIMVSPPPLLPMNNNNNEQSGIVSDEESSTAATFSNNIRKRSFDELSCSTDDESSSSIFSGDTEDSLATTTTMISSTSTTNNNSDNDGIFYCQPTSVVPVVDQQQKEDDNEVHQCRTFACKARGIKTRHDSENAIITVPHGARHGTLITCSHEECAATRRFRWCAVCEVPVAKRNFMKRHSHGLVTSVRYTFDHYLKDQQEQQKQQQSPASSKRLKLMPTTTTPPATPPLAPVVPTQVVPSTAPLATPAAPAPVPVTPTPVKETLATTTTANLLVQEKTAIPAFAVPDALNELPADIVTATIGDDPLLHIVPSKTVHVNSFDEQWLTLLRERPTTSTAPEQMTQWVNRVVQFANEFASPSPIDPILSDPNVNLLEEWNKIDPHSIFQD